MSVNKISDTVLNTEKRFNVSQDDVPGKSAQQMKEFMDYIPRQVLIPKINEVIDEFDTKANTDDVYAKTQADSLLLLKVDNGSVYKKSETYNKSEVDSYLASKANSTDVYTKAQSDAKLAGKADLSAVYTKSHVYSKTECDSLLTKKVENDSDRLITDTNTTPQGFESRLYRENGILKWHYRHTTDAIPEGSLASDYISPSLPCIYATKAELITAIQASWSANAVNNRVKIFALTDQNQTWQEPIYVALNGSEYSVVNDGYFSTNSWSLDEWINGQIDLCSYTETYTSDTLYLNDFTQFGSDVTKCIKDLYSALATEMYVNNAVSGNGGGYSLPTFNGASGFYNGLSVSNDSFAAFLNNNKDAPMIYLTDFNAEGYNESSNTQNIIFTNCGSNAFQGIQSRNRNALQIFTFTSDGVDWYFNIKACAYLS